MRIWVDADACPGAIREILYRAAERSRVPLVVANQAVPTPPSALIRAVRVPAGFDAADSHIAREMQAGDLVVTADIPLAAAVVARGGQALDPRGTLYTADNVGQRLAMRNLMQELRDAGLPAGGPAPLSPRDRKAFANQLDRLLTAHRQR
jgi:hypothetical protein